MATRKETDRWVLSASGMANIRQFPLTPEERRRVEGTDKPKAKPKSKGKRNGR